MPTRKPTRPRIIQTRFYIDDDVAEMVAMDLILHRPELCALWRRHGDDPAAFPWKRFPKKAWRDIVTNLYEAHGMSIEVDAWENFDWDPAESEDNAPWALAKAAAAYALDEVTAQPAPMERLA